MTCREMLKREHPTLVSSEYDGGCKFCPSDYGYLGDPEYCKEAPSDIVCGRCWDREITEKENETPMSNTKKTKAQLIEELKEATEKATALEKEIKDLEKYKKYDEAAAEIRAIYDSFVRAGFSDEQAFKLMNMTWQLAMSGNITASLQKVVRR